MSGEHHMQRLAVFFGGVTVEHEVSIITAVQLMNHAHQNYSVIPIYIDKVGKWWTGDSLFSIEYYKDQDLQKPTGLQAYTFDPNTQSQHIDVAILCFHGQYGESGNIQGLLEVSNIPYQGPGVTSSALCFDKIHVRQILQAEHISQPKYVWFTKQEWNSDSKSIVQKCSNSLSYPLFIKPANGGSTIGIQKAHTQDQLSSAIKEALRYDSRIIVEQAIQDCIEVNISVLGSSQNAIASVAEQPMSQDEFLSYTDKYERGAGKKSGMASASRRIPAPISSESTELLQNKAKEIFRILHCSGVIRIDFFINPSTNEYFVIEPNTIPGSMSYYLWEASDVSYSELIDKLVEIAHTEFANKKTHITSYQSNILQNNNTLK